MWTAVRAQLGYRRERTVATLLAILLAVTSFALLSSAAEGAQLQAVGTVKANYRPLYDILVRPRGAASALEHSSGLVQTDQLSSLGAGITTAQWQRILALPGVAVAAPVAVGGYVMQTGEVAVDLTRYLKPGVENQVLRIDPTWVTDQGTSRIPDGPIYFYATTDPLRGDPKDLVDQFYALQQHPDGSVSRVCVYSQPADSSGTGAGNGGSTQGPALSPSARSSSDCWSGNQNSTYPTYPTDSQQQAAAPHVLIGLTVPMLVAGIDPAQEAALDGLDRSVLQGRYLTESDGPSTSSFTDADRFSPATAGQVFRSPSIPVLASSTPDTGDRLQVTVSSLPPSAAASIASGSSLISRPDQLGKLPATRSGSTTVTTEQAYRQILAAMASPLPVYAAQGTGFDPVASSIWTTGAPTLTPHGSGLIEQPVQLPPAAWHSAAYEPGAHWTGLPVQLGDTATRGVVNHSPTDVNNNLYEPGAAPDGTHPRTSTELRSVGVFDPAKVNLGPALAPAPMDLYSQPGAPGADPASRTALGGQALGPDGDPAGPVAQRPTLLTTLSALTQLQKPPYVDTATGFGIDPAAPISTIRVRVTGRIGIDALSRDRISAIADSIRRATGLQVDFVTGSSSTAVATGIPAGKYGRPALTLAQPWLKQGVAAVVVTAVNRKSLLLAVLVLVACALAVGNAAGAAVRARVTELGVLACLGWSRPRLFQLVFTEAAVVGAAAGVGGTGCAFALAPALGVHLRLLYALLALPAALLLSLLAALGPAWRATRADPGAAVRPAVAFVRRPRPRRRISALARSNLLRAPGRTLLGSVSLALGIAALTLIAMIDLAFHSTVSGTLLGDAVVLQTRPTDYLAAGVTALLGAVAVADVLYVNIRERASEFALLGATGWSDGQLTRLAGYEAAGLGVLGAVLGAGSALGLATALQPTLPSAVYLTAALGAVTAVLLAVIAAAVPLRSLRNLPTARLLAEE
ncbi:FtsX-like permease family protein [Streptacidiphilus cavernicola]|uniref:FtsX-like permease family protein n=1 Tax=Streptacidiphilus cavernicola TaxID=3342716 RepID=A0ABV6VVU1_9ACTN